MKRLFDVALSFVILMIFSPVFFVLMILVWINDFHSPFYMAKRMARDHGTFNMIKYRSMIINAAKTGVNSSSSDDRRITPIGKYLRKFKLDELPQIINVFMGDMSFVGPRPQVKTDADLYTYEEKKILSVRPGITDLSSIVFADEGNILEGSNDPDLLYNQVIRPWKSRLALIYIQQSSLLLDIQLIYFTFLNVIDRQKVLLKIWGLIKRWNCDQKVLEIVRRDCKLYPYPPPGATEIVSSYPRINPTKK